MRVEPRLELARDREIVHRRADDDDVRVQKLFKRRGTLAIGMGYRAGRISGRTRRAAGCRDVGSGRRRGRAARFRGSDCPAPMPSRSAESSREAEALLKCWSRCGGVFTEFVLVYVSDLDEICDHTHLSRAQIHETRPIEMTADTPSAA